MTLIRSEQHGEHFINVGVLWTYSLRKMRIFSTILSSSSLEIYKFIETLSVFD